MVFDGVNQRINMGVAAIPDSTDFTLTSWVNIDDFSGHVVTVTSSGWTSDNVPPSNQTADSGTNRLFVLFVTAEETDETVTRTLNTVTYRGESCTRVGGIKVDDATADGYVEMWYLDEDGIAAGSGTSVVTTWDTQPSEELLLHAIYENVNQTTPVGDTETGTTTVSSTISTSATVSSDTGDIILAGIMNGNAGSTFTALNSFTKLIEDEDDQAPSGGMVGAVISKDGGSAETPSASNDDANRMCIFGAEINNVGTSSESHAIVHMGDNDTPYNGMRMYLKRGIDPGRIGLYDPDAAADNFSAAVAVTANQWDLAAIRGTKSGGSATALIGSWQSGTSDNDQVVTFTGASTNAPA